MTPAEMADKYGVKRVICRVRRRSYQYAPLTIVLRCVGRTLTEHFVGLGFSLCRPIFRCGNHIGWPHLTFYPDNWLTDSDTHYFGTGDSVLHSWKDKPPIDESSAGGAAN